MQSTPPSKIGVLIVNLGTPMSTSHADIRAYLKEFLSDPRVVEIPRLIWQLILRLYILPFRPKTTAHAYQQIWRQESNESPLRYYTRQQAVKLQQALQSEDLVIDWAMRYGVPSISEKIQGLIKAGCDRIAVIPLYPQYSAATTASVTDEVFNTLKNLRWQPAIRIAEPYHDHPLYIQALSNSIRDAVSELDWEPERVIASFHGIPKRNFEKGDPYYCFCHKTTRLVRETLGWTDDRLQMTFQSRFGKAAWLEPYTDVTLKTLAEQGMKKLAVICPGFASDCVETLEEIDIRARETFLSSGGTHFKLIPCLNDTASSIQLFTSLIQNTISGWERTA